MSNTKDRKLCSIIGFLGITSIFALIVGFPLWIIINSLLPVDKELILAQITKPSSLSTQKLAVGIVILIVICTISSLFVALRYSFHSSNEKLNPGVFFWQLTRKSKSFYYLYGFALGMRVLLTVYLIFFWYSLVTYKWFAQANFIMGMADLFGFWPFLYLVGVFCTIYFVIFEPWLDILFILLDKAAKTKSLVLIKISKKCLALISITLCRLIAYGTIIYLIFLFASSQFPVDGRPLLYSTGAYLALTIGFYLASRYFRMN